ncbi:actin-related protein 2/3 complex subunit 3-like [Oppia nitens]|uniref:actin-related protein 2/3 complex subunit 3-like n=1 Tax=Oppia nitens TaxID=1686743 RepID=UPI0023DC09CA|nr:actin-related protein 2/3 complex subunit 3-like [Oppia nitens]
MPSYHSTLTSNKSIANMSFMTFRTKFRGPVINLNDEHLGKDELQGVDIIDEAILYFKANVFFSSYEIQSEADRIIIYLTLYIIECLKKIQRCNNKNAAVQELTQLAISRFDIPGDPRFPLNGVFQKPKTADETELMRSYIQQLRQECSVRIANRVFETDNGQPSKWWTCFAKRKFMNISLSGPGN